VRRAGQRGGEGECTNYARNTGVGLAEKGPIPHEKGTGEGVSQGIEELDRGSDVSVKIQTGRETGKSSASARLEEKKKGLVEKSPPERESLAIAKKAENPARARKRLLKLKQGKASQSSTRGKDTSSQRTANKRKGSARR